MDPATPPPDTPPAPALAKGEPGGGGATNLAGPPEPPPGAEAPAPADPPPPAPRLSLRVRSVLRVLLATLALGWWTQHAMRRHFAVGPYTGPVYKFEERVDANGYEDYWEGVMDDTGRIIVPASDTRLEIDGRYVFVEEPATSWVWLDKLSKLPKRDDYIVTKILDMDGQLVWSNRRPILVMDEWRAYSDLYLRYLPVGDDLLLWEGNRDSQSRLVAYEVYRRTAEPTRDLRNRLTRLNGETLVEGNSMDAVSPTLMAMLNEWNSVHLVGQLEPDGPWRTLFEAGERWTESAYLSLYWDGLSGIEILLSDRPLPPVKSAANDTYSDDDDDDDDDDSGVFSGVGVLSDLSELAPTMPVKTPPVKPTIDPASIQLGVLGPTWRWQPPTSPWIGYGLIANAPGSRAGDPPVVLAEGEVDGAWLMLPNSENRLVRQGGKWGLQSAAGAWLVPPTWDGVAQEDELLLLRVVVDGLCGMVDADGRELIPPHYASVSVVGGQEDPVLFRVRSGGRAGPVESLLDSYRGDCRWLDDQGELVAALPLGIMAAGGGWVIPPALQTIEIESQGDRTWILAHDLATDTERLYHVDGTLALPDAWAHIHLLDGGLIVVETSEVAAACELFAFTFYRNDKYRPLIWDRRVTPIPGRQVLRVDGEPISLPPCDEFQVYADVGIVVNQAGRLGLLDLDGQPILSTAYAGLDITPDRQHVIVAIPPARTATDMALGRRTVVLRVPDGLATKTVWSSISDDAENPWYECLRVYDLASRSWLPRPLYAYKDGFAVAEPGNG